MVKGFHENMITIARHSLIHEVNPGLLACRLAIASDADAYRGICEEKLLNSGDARASVNHLGGRNRELAEFNG